MHITTAVSVGALIALVAGVEGGLLRDQMGVEDTSLQSTCMAGATCPPGLYQSTCNSCSTNSNGVLSCYCSGFGSTYQLTTLPNSFTCGSNIFNMNGALTCQLPAGNFGQSCIGCGLGFGNTLTCQCLTGTGSYVSSTLSSVSTCSYVENLNGILTCSGGTPAPSTPSPTAPTGSNTCNWSSNTITGERQPSNACSSFTALQGCSYNNYCCFSQSANTCGPVPGCPNCLGLTSSQCSAFPTCCGWNGSACARTCPSGGVTNVATCGYSE